MKHKILAFGASSSRQSINKRFATYAAQQVPDSEVRILDLNDFEMPIYSIDRERESGIPQPAHAFKQAIQEADGIIISFAEHNGSYTAAFKNIMDWTSRIKKDLWENKPMLLLATSPGKRGGKSVLEQALRRIEFVNDNTVVGFSLPSFHQSFNDESGIVDAELAAAFNNQFELFLESLNTPVQASNRV